MRNRRLKSQVHKIHMLRSTLIQTEVKVTVPVMKSVKSELRSIEMFSDVSLNI